MKTKQIPAVVMLLAGLILCIVGYIKQLELGEFLQLLLTGMIIFYIIGEIAKAVLDPFFREDEKNEEEESQDEDSEETEESSVQEDGAAEAEEE